MNTYEELIGMGLNQRNALSVLESQRRRIGEEHGDFRVKDMTYVKGKKREVLLSCKYCGTEIKKEVLSTSGTKWDRVQAICECQKRAQKEETQARRILAYADAAKKRDEDAKSRIGQIYGEYKISGISDGDYVVQCQMCGAVTKWSIAGFRQRVDYKCHIHRKTVERFTEAYIGMKNNYLTVIGLTWGVDGRKLFRCRCDCGRITLVKPSKWENGTIVSCNCYLANRSVDAAPEKRIKNIWNGMKRRCYNPKSKDYSNYGGRGITICSEWLIFENFLKWSLENGYDNTKTIDRADLNGNYEPGNCRWTTWDVQNSNRRPRKSQKYYEELKNGTSYR